MNELRFEAEVPAASALLAVVEATLRDLHSGPAQNPAPILASSLDRDLGFDSLGRMELLLRVERAFGVALPADTLQTAETVADLLRAVQFSAARHPRQARSEAALPRAAALDALQPAPTSQQLEATTTLLEVLAWHVQAHPEQTQLVILTDGHEQPMVYRQLAAAAGAIAAGLQEAGVRPRECVAIMLPTSAEYFSTYLGILMAGAIPVPIYPPGRPSQIEDHVRRHAAILDNAQATLLVTSAETGLVARLLRAQVPCVRRVVTPERLATPGGMPSAMSVAHDDIAFIQYTSGSTGDPKGVMLSHANLLANIRAMAQAIGATPADVFVSWLPLYHDMGLIGAWLGSLYVGFPLVVMSPMAFLARPVQWLQAIHRWRGTLSAAPNFAYELCLKRVEEAQLAGLDLSSWRLAFNGAEPVSPSTVRAFAERFSRCGLRPEAIAPVYGLAEASVGLLFPPLGRVAPIDAVQRDALTREGRATPAAKDDAAALHFVGCGRPLPGHSVRIVDEAGEEVGERIEGTLEFKGPSATRGYFRDPKRTNRLFHDGWLDSGDRAYRAAGDFYITGRQKDIVIRAGRKLYPEEIEKSVGELEGVRKGCVAVFGSPDPARGTERLVVMAEVQPRATGTMPLLRERVACAVIATIGEPPDEITLVQPHTVPKTSSGKVRRSACRMLFEQGRAAAAAAPVRRQLLRLVVAAMAARLRLTARVSAQLLFGAFAVLLFWLLAPLVWLLTLLMPTPAAAWVLGRAVARALFLLTGTNPRVTGLEHLPLRPCVLVSNHASYLDGVILVAVLPRPYAFVAKRELSRHLIAGPYLRRLGAEFVERFDVKRAVEDARAMSESVARGRSLLVFPEGTLNKAPGLLPFRLGAFLAAAEAGVPVVPIALHGSRDVLPAGLWWPRHAKLRLDVCAPIESKSEMPDLFAAAVQLREAARQAIESVDAEL